MRLRAGVVLIEDGKVVLIRRENQRGVYFLFPGGGVERGESLHEAAKREALEEMGLEVRIGDLLLCFPFRGTVQFFFVAEYLSGVIGTGNGEEFIRQTPTNRYEPVWMPLDQIRDQEIFPKEVVEKLLEITV